MYRLRVFISRLLGSFGLRSDSRLDLDLETELNEHLRLLTEENIRHGMNEADALAAAHCEFGGIEQTKEKYRDQRGLPTIETTFRDAKFTLRALKRQPVFALVAILTLALGIGATTATFSVVDRILFRSLPYTRRRPPGLLWRDRPF